MNNYEQNKFIRSNFRLEISDDARVERAMKSLSPDKFIQFLHELGRHPEDEIEIDQGEVHTPITDKIVLRGADKLKKLHDYQYTQISDDECPRCHKFTLMMKSKQTRRADEAATVYEYCLSCKFKRRE